MPKRAHCQGCGSWSGELAEYFPIAGRIYCWNTFCSVGEVKFARLVDNDQDAIDASVADAQKRFNEEAHR